jgi:hypothetical protein
MSNRTEARSAKAARMHTTGRLPLLRLFSTPLFGHLVRVFGTKSPPPCGQDHLAQLEYSTSPSPVGSHSLAKSRLIRCTRSWF